MPQEMLPLLAAFQAPRSIYAVLPRRRPVFPDAAVAAAAVCAGSAVALRAVVCGGAGETGKRRRLLLGLRP